MSVLERPISPLKPEIKPKPEIPPRSMLRNSTSPVGGTSSSDTTPGKVKKIAERFTKQDPSEAGEHLVNGSPELSSNKQSKKPPEIKPKPDISYTQPQVGTEQVPPLPKKRSRLPKKQRESIDGNGEDMNTDRGRSAPDGKEVEVHGAGAVEAKTDDAPYSLLSSCCSKTCTCMCHQNRPGMMLIWVPVDEQDAECPGKGAKDEVQEQREETVQKVKCEPEIKPAEKEEDLGTEEKDTEVQDEQYESKLPAVKKGEMKEAEEEMGEDMYEEEKQQEAAEMMEVHRPERQEEIELAEKGGGDTRAEEDQGEERKDEGGDETDMTPVRDEKSKFYQSLEMLLAEGPKKPSDQSPPAPLKRRESLLSKPPQPLPVLNQQPEDEEESIYELHLPVASQPIKKISSPRKDLRDIPQINVHKPARRDKPAHSSVDPETQSNNATAPPAIPPRVPVNGAPVPQKENTSGRTSPSTNLSLGRVRPPPPSTSPPRSPLIPLRPPPSPPNADSRRLSNASMQSTILFEENKSSKEKEGRDRSSIKKMSFKREFRLSDEPLYQTYNDFAIKKELRQQSIIRSISKASADYAMGWVARHDENITVKLNGSKPARASLVPTMSHSTLWQELPAVRDSGVLDTLTSEQIKYQESMFEVLTSETSYLRSLYVLTDHFMENRELYNMIIINDRKTLFSNTLKVREVSERFLKDLENHILKEIVFPDICDIINYHAQHNFSPYIDYVRNQIYQEKTYSRLMKTNEQFAAMINRLQELPQCQRLPFISFLLLPFQRITRLRMLIENILKRTKEGTPEEKTASKALASVSKIIDCCNREVGKMRQMEELVEISNMLEYDKLKAFPIISESRSLEKKGELQEMSKTKTFVNMRAKFSPVYLFLFNDRLLITIKKSSDRYVVVDHSHRTLVQVEPLEETSGGATYENCFNLIMLENHQGRKMERLLKAPSKSDMERWLAAFPSSTKDDVEEEVIYEDWDCPQVQCVERYVAQQGDELSLEPTELVNVTRKTNEGWYEGIRLSDGQKGWFPTANVIEITNEHVRRRNIKERYRLAQATMKNH
ncbi:rho guanine nucleotide exchange factor 15 [Cyprinodon tularosa]|uniref:rho guanine nucleotide exchange factor 15 n=1 Tax=Cyprinodon tularosa TaxID=77115 RepID=UPI0018E28ACF|nr:rho guanine nucleotide exchange factor 15 [Cyprinodon tularosa]